MSLKGFSYCVNNLRSIKEMGIIDLKKINILVGKNSVGKSSFLRSLWLIKRSLSSRSGAPIMWYGGREDPIDFGDFQTSLNRFASEDVIKFKFAIGKLRKKYTSDLFLRNFIFNSKFHQRIETASDLFLEVHVKDISGVTRKHKATASFKLNGRSVKIDIDYQYIDRIGPDQLDGDQSDLSNRAVKCSIEIDGTDILRFFKNQGLHFIDVSNTLFPSLVPALDREGELSVLADFPECAEFLLFSAIKNSVHGNVANIAEVVRDVLAIISGGQFNKEKLRPLMAASKPRWMKEFYKNLSDESSYLFKKVGAIEWLLASGVMISYIGEAVVEIVNSTINIGPLRANVERFYRVQDLQTSSIEPDGSNLAMWLSSLSDKNRKEFSSFVERLFGYKVEIKRTASNVSIIIVNEDISMNVVDTGFGISQMLPILSLIWLSGMSRSVRAGASTRWTITPVLVEQPELHLHPAYQARLADAFVEAFQGENDDVRFVIETHSEALLNRFGDLVVDGAIEPDDIQILVFDDGNLSGDKSGGVSISIAKFDEEGRLINWPFGFFNRDI